ncbi:hypothetical protein C8C96_4842 [Acidovorax sp. 100]|uniref:transcriptional regulator n=1 Tax=Acidovorax sp. 100 TaxID=2135635 RepID=UPI000EF9F366|nr:transcriptional regulator [Acidovorax sp. 100]RMA56425.1 hypothetical protein C8C96_4842 [Acidovorax sp. 100]
MTAFNEAFRSEIARIARKESKKELDHLRKSVSSQRSEIASLKRSLHELERTVRLALRHLPAPEPKQPKPVSTKTKGISTEALVAKREAVALTVAEMAILLNVSPLTLRRWEAQEAFPRKMHHERIHAVLAMGKRQAKRLLTEGESPA